MVPVEITIGFFGTWDAYKSLKAVPESISLVELLFEKKCFKGDYKLWICASGGIGPSDKINQAQSRTKLLNFGGADTRTKTRKSAGTGIQRDLFWKVIRTETSLYPV